MKISRTRVGILIAIGGFFSLFACNAIIGTRDLSFDQNAPGGDSGTQSGKDSGAQNGGDSSTATDSATPCTDTTSDSNNCGSCGHSCFGGSCNSSKCEPFTIIDTLPNAIAMTLDANNVYWSDYVNNAVYAVPKGGGAKATIASTGFSQPWGLAASATTLYIASYEDGASGGGIYSCAIAGCPGGAAARALQEDSPRWFALGTPPTTLFVATASTIESVDISKTPLVGHTNAIANMGFHVTADASYVYFTDNSVTIHRQPVAATGGAAPNFGNSALNFAGDIFVDSTRLYWTNGDTPPNPGNVNGVSKDGTGAVTMYGGANNKSIPLGITSDGTTVFWVTQNTATADDGTLASCPVSGCTSPTVLISNLPNPNTIILDGGALYVSCSGDDGANNGKIFRLAKP